MRRWYMPCFRKSLPLCQRLSIRIVFIFCFVCQRPYVQFRMLLSDTNDLYFLLCPFMAVDDRSRFPTLWNRSTKRASWKKNGTKAHMEREDGIAVEWVGSSYEMLDKLILLVKSMIDCLSCTSEEREWTMPQEPGCCDVKLIMMYVFFSSFGVFLEAGIICLVRWHERSSCAPWPGADELFFHSPFGSKLSDKSLGFWICQRNWRSSFGFICSLSDYRNDPQRLKKQCWHFCCWFGRFSKLKFWFPSLYTFFRYR